MDLGDAADREATAKENVESGAAERGRAGGGGGGGCGRAGGLAFAHRVDVEGAVGRSVLERDKRLWEAVGSVAWVAANGGNEWVCNVVSPNPVSKFFLSSQKKRWSIEACTMWRAAVAVAALLVGMAPTGRGISLRQAARNREPSEVVPNYDDTRESNSPSWLPPVPSWEEQPWEGATIGGEYTRPMGGEFCCRTECVHSRMDGVRSHGWLAVSLPLQSSTAPRCFVSARRGPGNPRAVPSMRTIPNTRCT